MSATASALSGGSTAHPERALESEGPSNEWLGIVLFIGEGLTPSRVTVTRLYLGGADTGLAIGSMPFMALLSNQSRDFAVPACRWQKIPF